MGMSIGSGSSAYSKKSTPYTASKASTNGGEKAHHHHKKPEGTEGGQMLFLGKGTQDNGTQGYSYDSQQFDPSNPNLFKFGTTG